MDDRYITEEYDGGIRISMKVYKEWVAENGEPQVFHKTDTVGFKSPLVKEDYKWALTITSLSGTTVTCVEYTIWANHPTPKHIYVMSAGISCLITE